MIPSIIFKDRKVSVASLWHFFHPHPLSDHGQEGSLLLRIMIRRDHPDNPGTSLHFRVSSLNPIHKVIFTILGNIFKGSRDSGEDMFLEEGGIVLSTSNWYGRRSRVEFKKKKSNRKKWTSNQVSKWWVGTRQLEKVKGYFLIKC